MVNIKCTLKYICVRVVPKRSYYKITMYVYIFSSVIYVICA